MHIIGIFITFCANEHVRHVSQVSDLRPNIIVFLSAPIKATFKKLNTLKMMSEHP